MGKIFLNDTNQLIFICYNETNQNGGITETERERGKEREIINIYIRIQRDMKIAQNAFNTILKPAKIFYGRELCKYEKRFEKGLNRIKGKPDK